MFSVLKVNCSFRKFMWKCPVLYLLRMRIFLFLRLRCHMREGKIIHEQSGIPLWNSLPSEVVEAETRVCSLPWCAWCLILIIVAFLICGSFPFPVLSFLFLFSLSFSRSSLSFRLLLFPFIALCRGPIFSRFTSLSIRSAATYFHMSNVLSRSPIMLSILNILTRTVLLFFQNRNWNK